MFNELMRKLRHALYILIIYIHVYALVDDPGVFVIFDLFGFIQKNLGKH